MDGEVSDSTYAEDFAEAHPERFFEMFRSEQQLVAAAVGFSVRAVLEALAEAGPLELSVASLAVRELPGSGSGDELMNAAGISAPRIVEAARSLVAASSAS
jgi:hypothetical protein